MATPTPPAHSSPSRIRPGAAWRDTAGGVIQAHGGGLIEHGGAVYWFGEDKSGPTTLNTRGTARVPFVGIACYRSTDLVAWERLGTALHAVEDDPAHPLHPSMVVERPKVLFDPVRERFVMWVKAGGPNYEYMHFGVAVSDTVAGPYEFLGTRPPNDGMRGGDFALLRDESGVPYLIHPAEKFAVLPVARLSDDATGFTGEYHRCLESEGGYDGHEAPALFRHDGRWYMLTSRVSGWRPNPCRACVADRLTGPWEVLGELCDPEQTQTTFDSQPACILPIDPARGRFLYAGDRWDTDSLGDSRYIWLPIRWRDGRPVLQWVDAWAPDDDAAWRLA